MQQINVQFLDGTVTYHTLFNNRAGASYFILLHHLVMSAYISTFILQLFSLERVQYKLKGNWMMIMNQVGASI